MAAGQLYEKLGHGYASARPADPRVTTQVHDAIGPAASVVNLGAGTGNYEPDDGLVIAVEPSATMIAQRDRSHPVARSVAEALPFPDACFEVALALFTVHHWTDRSAGLAEMGRVSHRQVSLVYDTTVSFEMWLLDYFSELRTAPWEQDAPTADTIGDLLEIDEVRILWVPADCSDGFSGAYWNRPERYLEPEVQAGMSTLARLAPAARAAGTERLRRALEEGEWDRRHGHLRTRSRFDMGYRLVCSRAPRRARSVRR